MTYPSYLTVLRPDQDDAMLKACMTLTEGAYLHVMVVAKAPPPPASSYDMLNGTAWLEASDLARNAAKERADEVEALLAKAGQEGAVTSHVAGPVHLADLVAAASRTTDLVLLPRILADHPGLHHALVTGALFDSGAPVMTFDPSKPPKQVPGHVLVAWNATPEGGRALRAAIPVLKVAKQVTLLLIDPQPSPRGHSVEPGADVAAYLSRHGVHADVLKVPGEGRREEEEIARQVNALGADLLVMGGYGHSRLRERIFGGTTQAILADPPCAVLLAH
ncbi:universal stress protein [Oceanibium sediminis]|uniref:universal stress protein n=1 Tax=Oceanibium sediminis TaxID=2026339 RepID=UPI000DD317B5|nr:universal stress protein [Oceanibium sediminis]